MRYVGRSSRADKFIQTCSSADVQSPASDCMLDFPEHFLGTEYLTYQKWKIASPVFIVDKNNARIGNAQNRLRGVCPFSGVLGIV